MARGLFIEPFYGGSHRAFADGLVRHSRHSIDLLTLPEGEWRRRMRSGAQELAPQAMAAPGEVDFLIATDMLDLGTFLALTRRRFGSTPVLLYMHENQFTYPRIAGTKLNSWFGAMNYLSALAANRVAFNSPYHREDFLGALRTLSGMPNNWLDASRIDEIEAKSVVLPVGVELDWLDELRPENLSAGVPLILWNHRWEFDKAPDVFARALLALAGEGVAFRVAIAGDPGLNPHPALAELRESLGERIVQFGKVERREAYGRLLWASDVTVSTTRHEFFGVGMVEAMYCGCLPVAPAQFTYPWLIPAELHATCLWETEPELLWRLRHAIRSVPPPAATAALRTSAERFAWPRITTLFDAEIDALLAR